jgi:manganese/iron transport system substrate-binding protein
MRWNDNHSHKSYQALSGFLGERPMFQHWLPTTVHFAGIATVLLGLGLVGCSQEPVAQNDDAASETAAEEVSVELPQVVATTSVICDLTEQIAQDTIALTCLMDPGQDPHTYQAKPSDRQAIDEADLVLYDGYDFAPGLIGLVDASSNSAPKVAVYERPRKCWSLLRARS